MAAQTCPLCQQHRARRACPALGRLICATCCGAKRLVEIRCPADCVYLTRAREHPPAAVQRQQERDLRFLLPHLHHLTELQSHLFFAVQTVLRAAAEATPGLVDQDVIDAADALANTYETATRGVIYEHRPTSLPAQHLAGHIREELGRLASERGGPPLRDRDMAVVMRRIDQAARELQKAEPNQPRAFLGLIRRIMADPASAGGAVAGPPTGAGSSLVLP